MRHDEALEPAAGPAPDVVRISVSRERDTPAALSQVVWITGRSEGLRAASQAAALAMRAGEPAQTLSIYREILALLPGERSTLLGAATALRELGRPAEAERLCLMLLEKNPHDRLAITLEPPPVVRAAEFHPTGNEDAMNPVRTIASAPPAAKALPSQHGFTLVELAIVLVIIGLIIGGILKGQELIASARLKSTLTDIDAIRAAAAIFQDKYGGTPNGITWRVPRWSGTNQLCDGDGIIEGNGRTNETLLFWQHLALGNLISGLAVQYQAIGGRTTHWLRLGTGGALTTGVADGVQASSIDSKVDDGRPGTGSVRVTTSACINSSSYNPSGDQCLMYYEFN